MWLNFWIDALVAFLTASVPMWAFLLVLIVSGLVLRLLHGWFNKMHEVAMKLAAKLDTK